MPKYAANPAKDTAAGFFDPPNGMYEVKATGVKAFERENANHVLTHGVRVNLQIVEGEFAERNISGLQLYYHTEGGAGMAKSYIMAILGMKDEKEFNTFAETLDWGYDPETGSVGDAFQELKGKRFKVQTEEQLIPGTEKTRIQITKVLPL